MQIEGITWHGVTLEPDQFSAMKKLCREVFGLTPMIERDGWTLFPMQNGTVLDLIEPDSELIPAYGLMTASCSASVLTTSKPLPLNSKRQVVSCCATFIASPR
jgi:hypothetical protein